MGAHADSIALVQVAAQAASDKLAEDIVALDSSTSSTKKTVSSTLWTDCGLTARSSKLLQKPNSLN